MYFIKAGMVQIFVVYKNASSVINEYIPFVIFTNISKIHVMFHLDMPKKATQNVLKNKTITLSR